MSAEAKMADERAGFNSYEIKASPNQVNESPTRLVNCDINSFANVLFLRVRNGSITISFNLFILIVLSLRVKLHLNIQLIKFSQEVMPEGQKCFNQWLELIIWFTLIQKRS